jgi:hypothetical protein
MPLGMRGEGVMVDVVPLSVRVLRVSPEGSSAAAAGALPDGAGARTIVVLNRGWAARALVPEARRLAAEGERSIVLVYVVPSRRRPRRLWLWLGRRTIRRVLGPHGSSMATVLTVSRSVIAGVGLVASATGGEVVVRLGDARRDAELRTRCIPRLALDPARPGS